MTEKYMQKWFYLHRIKVNKTNQNQHKYMLKLLQMPISTTLGFTKKQSFLHKMVLECRIAYAEQYPSLCGVYHEYHTEGEYAHCRIETSGNVGTYWRPNYVFNYRISNRNNSMCAHWAPLCTLPSTHIFVSNKTEKCKFRMSARTSIALIPMFDTHNNPFISKESDNSKQLN